MTSLSPKMNIAVCTKDDIALSPLKDIIRADFPDAEFLICDPSTLPLSPDKFHMILCDGEALLIIWQCEKLRSVYFPTDPLALVVPIDGKASIFFKSYTSKGAKLVGLSRDRSGTRSPMIPLFHSLEEITEDGTADDFLLYVGSDFDANTFAVRHGGDTLIAEYADRVKSGSRTILSIGGNRRVGRLRMRGNGVAVEGNFFTFEECERLPLFVIARIKKILKGRN